MFMRVIYIYIHNYIMIYIYNTYIYNIYIYIMAMLCWFFQIVSVYSYISHHIYHDISNGICRKISCTFIHTLTYIYIILLYNIYNIMLYFPFWLVKSQVVAGKKTYSHGHGPMAMSGGNLLPMLVPNGPGQRWYGGPGGFFCLLQQAKGGQVGS